MANPNINPSPNELAPDPTAELVKMGNTFRDDYDRARWKTHIASIPYERRQEWLDFYRQGQSQIQDQFARRAAEREQAPPQPAFDLSTVPRSAVSDSSEQVRQALADHRRALQQQDDNGRQYGYDVPPPVAPPAPSVNAPSTPEPLAPFSEAPLATPPTVETPVAPLPTANESMPPVIARMTDEDFM